MPDKCICLQIAKSFADLGLTKELCRAVADKGYTQPTPIQAQSIPAILEGRDVFGGAQTGTGKTASFTLPLLQINSRGPKSKNRTTRALILVPTRELAAQVRDSVRGYGAHLSLKSVTVAGGIPLRVQIKEVQRGADVIIATPGRLLDLIERKSVSLTEINTLVLDEADRMLDMGFMPDIRKILKHVSTERQTLLFSATPSKQIEKLAESILKKPLRIQAGEQNQVPANVTHIVYFIARNDKPAALAKLFKDKEWGQTLVFTRTKADADSLKEKLMEHNLTARVIHGGKTQVVRTKTLKRFKSGQIKILIATDVAARGLDINSLPLVVNYELPQSPDDYIHRIGRTGRAGNKGTAVSLISKTERYGLARIEQKVKKSFNREKLEGFEEKFSSPPASKRGPSKGKPTSRGKKFDPFRGRVSRREFNGKKKESDKKPWDKKKSSPGKPGHKNSFNKPGSKKKKDYPKPGHPQKKTGFERFYTKHKNKKRR